LLERQKLLKEKADKEKLQKEKELLERQKLLKEKADKEKADKEKADQLAIISRMLGINQNLSNSSPQIPNKKCPYGSCNKHLPSDEWAIHVSNSHYRTKSQKLKCNICEIRFNNLLLHIREQHIKKDDEEENPSKKQKIENPPELNQNIERQEVVVEEKPKEVKNDLEDVFFFYKLAVETGRECEICFEEFKIGDDMARMECLCSFHKCCILDWYKRKQYCPTHQDKLSASEEFQIQSNQEFVVPTTTQSQIVNSFGQNTNINNIGNVF